MKSLILSAVLLIALTFSAKAQEEMNRTDPSIMPSPHMEPGASTLKSRSFEKYEKFEPEVQTSTARMNYRVRKSQRGTTTKVPVSVVAQLCGDFDGCEVRIGMYNWDNAGRVASRETLLFYNTVNHAWRNSLGDRSGKDFNGVTEHIIRAWACYFTDGRYANWANQGDPELNFGLLSWSQYNAECRLTIID